jgi:hypothetical protein
MTAEPLPLLPIPQRRARRQRVAKRLGIVLVLVAIVMQSYIGRVHSREDSVAGCVRGQTDRSSLIALNNDVGHFAQLLEGLGGTTRRDRKIADTAYSVRLRSEFRADEIGSRLPPRLRCEDAYPMPTLIPWVG